MAEWLPLAESGDATAQNSVGALYDRGLGVDEDDSAAAHWYQLAAEQSLPLAMRNLANMYAGGHGVPYDEAQAEIWYEKAAKMGDPVAIKRMAALHPSSEFAAAVNAEAPAPVAEPMTVAGDGDVPEAAPVPKAPDVADTASATGEAATAATLAPAAGESNEALQYGESGAQQPAAETAPAAPATTQQAALAQPPASSDAGNWLFGMWQGPSLGCPPEGGMEFAPGETRSYYGGQMAARMPAKYKVAGDRITVTSVGLDGVGHDYEYERRGPNTFVIAAVPSDMPSSMIGVEHRRCAGGPLAAAAPQPATTPTPSPAPEPEAEAAEPEAATLSPAVQPLVSAAPTQPAPKAAPVNPVTEAAQPQPIAGAQQAAAAPKDAAPGTPKAGWDAFGRGDYKGALEVWQPLAEKGDVAMQLLVGSIYDYGQGVPQDDAEAVKWYERAASQGSAKGQFQAGAVYARSSQIKDPVQAYKWLTIAARSLASGPQGGVTEDQATTLRTLIQNQMSKDEIAKAKAEADAFKAKKS